MTTPISAKEIKRNRHLIDLSGQTLGRISTQIAALLMGKAKVNQTPNLDMGDYVVAINAKDIKVTGKKLADKKYPPPVKPVTKPKTVVATAKVKKYVQAIGRRRSATAKVRVFEGKQEI